jgi:hypothetical protein
MSKGLEETLPQTGYMPTVMGFLLQNLHGL